jgi:DNA-binding transcriptional MerR regulator
MELGRETTALLSDFFSDAQLAAEIGVHPRTLRKWDERGEGPPKTVIGRKVLYRRQSVIEWLASREQRRGKGRRTK